MLQGSETWRRRERRRRCAGVRREEWRRWAQRPGREGRGGSISKDGADGRGIVGLEGMTKADKTSRTFVLHVSLSECILQLHRRVSRDTLRLSR